ncbi:uncharacterized protein LOC115881011 [Sitophilus oryzae]|uniref:Uncharacterized protein LOC115881011 n=1 Tax=Sitophilus oryzae TaxID=7048 RepID=A0A6J2XRZ1_SITOR|nr:uncharacterized protein LOC115881011 [Sitophilus oryzae]
MSDDDGFSECFDEPNMEIQIKTLLGTTFDIKVSSNETVADIKKKIYRVEGIPIYQQNLIFRSTELKDTIRLCDSGIINGSTLTLVASMRGGPISTRRLSVSCDHYLLKELRELLENSADEVTSGSKVSVLVFKEGDIINLLRVIENEDGSYSPYSESTISPPSKSSKKDTLETFQRLVEDTQMCTKLAMIRKKMEDLNEKRKSRTRKDEACTSEIDKDDSFDKFFMVEEGKKCISYKFLEDCASGIIDNMDLTIFERSDEGNQSESEEIALKDKHRTRPKVIQNLSIPKPSSTTSKSIYNERKNSLSSSYSHTRQNYARIARKKESLERSDSSNSSSSSQYTVYSRDRNDWRSKSDDEELLNPVINLEEDPILSSGGSGFLDSNFELGLGQESKILPELAARSLGPLIPDISSKITSLDNKMSSPWNNTNPLPSLISKSRDGSPILEINNASVVEEMSTKLADQLHFLDEEEGIAVGARNRVHLTRLVLSSEGAERPKSSPNGIELEERGQELWEIREPAGDRLKHSATCKVGLVKRHQGGLEYNYDSLENTQTNLNSDLGKFSKSSTEFGVCSGTNYFVPQYLSTPSAIPPQYAPKQQSNYCDLYFRSERRSPLYSRRNRKENLEETDSSNKDNPSPSSSVVAASSLINDSSSIERLKNDESQVCPKSKEELLHDFYGYCNEGSTDPALQREEEKSEEVKLPPVIKKKSRCTECNRKLNITNIYNCRCGRIFCSQHRYSELHKCTYDYKTEGRKILERQNPLVTAEKIKRL